MAAEISRNAVVATLGTASQIPDVATIGLVKSMYNIPPIMSDNNTIDLHHHQSLPSTSHNNIPEKSFSMTRDLNNGGNNK